MRSQRLLVLAARTDTKSRKVGNEWFSRCLHCGAQVGVARDGSPLGSTTLEHIVPRSWFGTRPAEPLVAVVGEPDDPRNLALACARCNQQKGRTHDARGPLDARAVAVVTRLLDRRLARFTSSERLDGPRRTA